MAETVTFTVQLRDEMSSGLRQVRSELDTTANAATKLADASDPKHNGFNESAKQAKTLSDRVKDAAGSLKQAVTGSTAYKAGMEHVTGVTRKTLSTLDALREKAVSSSKTLASIDAGLSAAVTRARGALSVLGNTAGNVAGRVGQAFRGAGDKLAPAFNRVGEALNPVVSKARTVFDKISDVAQPAVQKTVTVFRGVADKLTTVFDRVKPKFPGIVEGAKQAGEKAGQVIKKGLTGVAVAGVAAAGAVAGVAFSKGFGRLKNIEQAQAKLTGLGHSAEGVAALMENANQAVKGTAFGLDEAAGTAATMAAAGVQAGQEMTDILTLVGDAATIGGSSMSEMGAIFGKVASKGKLDGEVMAQLMDRQIGILPDLAKFYNVTTEQAAKMVSKGQVTFEEFAIIMQDKVGGAAQKSGETFTGAMANMKAALGRIGATLLTPFFSQAPRFLTALTGIIDGAHKALKPVMERFGKAFEPLADSVLKVLEGFAENGVNGVMEQIGKLVPALAPLMGALGALASGPLQALVNKIPMLGNVAFTINPLAGAIGGLVVGVPELRNAFMDLLKTVGGSLMEAFTSLAPAVGSLATTFTDVLGSAVKAVMPVITTLIEMIGPLLTGVIKAVVPIIGAVLNVVVNVVKALMPAVESIMKAVAPILALVGRLVTALLPVLNIVTGLVTLLGKILVPVINVLAKVVAVVFPVIAKIIEVALLAVIWVVEKIVGLFQHVLPGVITWFRDTVVPWLTGVWEAISAGVVWLVQNIGPMFVALWHGMGAVVSWVWQNVIQPSWEAIKVGFNAVAQFFVFVWQNILKPVFTGIGWVAQWVWQNILQPAWAGMKQWFAGLVEDMRLRWETVLKPMFHAVGAVFRWVWQNILQPAFTMMKLHWQVTLLGIQLLWETILKPTFNNVGNAVRFLRTNVWDPAVSGMKRAWQAMGNGLQWVKANIIDPVFSGIKSGVHAVANSFNSAKEAIGRYWGQIREKVASPIRFVIQTVYNKGLRPVWNGIASAVNMKNLQLPEHKLSFASGGVMPGYTPGRDVHKFYSPTGGLLELSGGETIFRPEVTKALGVKEVTQINAVAKRSGVEGVRDYLEYGGERAQAFNTGGVLSFDGGGVMPSRVQQAQAWARAQVGKPYIWGGVGPRGYDCSGFMSAITNYLLGQNPYSRRFATGAFSKNRGAGGFQPGMKSAFVIGVSPNTGRGIGHTAGTLGGMNVESYGGHGPAVGSGARGATDRLFPWQFYLPQAGGEFIGGGPGGGGGPVRLFDLNPLKKISGLFNRVPDAGGWSSMLVGGLKTLLKGMVDKVSPLQWADGAVDAAVNAASTGSAFAQGQAWAVAKRLNPAEIAAMNYIVSKESSWNPRAKNPSSSASGLPQFIDATSRAYLGGAPASQYSPIQQLNGMDRYVRERWGGWLGAMGQWKRHHWYKDGGVTLFDNGGLWPHGAVGMNMSGGTEMALTNEQRQLLTTAMGNVAAYTGETGPGRLGDVNITLTGDVYGMDDLEQRLSGVVETLVEEIYREWEERR